MRQSVWVFLGIVLLKVVVWAGPELFVENNVFDFGEVVDGTIVKCVFLLKNTGDAPLGISRISHACGCTSYTLSAREIAPGETAALTVWFDTTGYANYPQPVFQVLTIFSNDPKGPREVRLEGRVITVRPSTAGKTPSESELPVTSRTDAAPKPTLVSLQVDLVTSEDAEAVLPLLELIETYGWRTTVYVTGEIALAYPNLVKEIHDRGHQIGVLGWEAGEDLLSMGENELYERLENAFLAVRAAVGEMRPEYIADFKPQGHQVNQILLHQLSRLGARTCTGIFSNAPDHPYHLGEGYGSLVAIPLAHSPRSGEVLASATYVRAGKSAEEFFADLVNRYETYRLGFKPFAVTVNPSALTFEPQGMAALRTFLGHLANTSGQVAVVDQLSAQANPFIDWIKIEAPNVGLAGEKITITVRYRANCYCPRYYFMIYGCEHGTLCDLPLVRGLFWDPLYAEQQFPPYVGEHHFTFTPTKPLPLKAGNYSYRIVAVGQACHGGPCWPTFSETIPAKYDAIASTEIQVISPPVRLLFVPLNWNTTQDAFDSYVMSEVERFIANTPLQNCSNPIYAHRLTVSDHNITNFTGDLAYLRRKAREFLQTMDLNIALFHVVVGVAPEPPDPKNPRIQGLSNRSDTIWIVDDHIYTLAHELGHIKTFGGLWDEYCSKDAGSVGVTECNSATQQPNPLDRNPPCDCPADGSNDSQGVPCCNAPGLEPCVPGKLNVCCYGNKVKDSGRCIMSYAGAPGPRAFCIHCQAQLKKMPILTECAAGLQTLSTEGEMNEEKKIVIILELTISKDGSVIERDVGVRPGTTAPFPWPNPLGAYTLRIIDVDGNTMYEQSFDLFFGYTGPVLPGVDYTNIQYDNFLLSVRIPFLYGMHSVFLTHGGQPIYTRVLPVATIRGTVKAEEGPIVGAFVTARGPSFVWARTDDQGRYVIAVTEPGLYYINVEPADPNLMPIYQTVEVELEQVYTLDFVLNVGGSISGRVTDAAGNPVTEAWIYPQVLEPPYYKVNENGEYVISGLTPGDHVIAIEAPGYPSWYIYVNNQYITTGTSVRVTVERGKTTQVNFTQRPPGMGVVYDFEYASQAEAEAVGWTFSGLWRLITEDHARRFSPRPTPFPSSIRAAYFGSENGNYITLGTLGTEIAPATPELRMLQAGSQRSYGELTSPPITVSGLRELELSFRYFREVEYYPQGSYDRTFVQVSFDGSEWQTVWSRDSKTESERAWTGAGPIRITVPSGASTMRIRFVFDSVDRYHNNYLGWLVDDVRIMSAAPGIAQFTYTNLSVSPTSGPTPLRITATVTVTNIGTIRGTEVVRFYVNGVERANQIVVLNPGASKTVSFDFTFTEPGTYSVTIDNLTPVTVLAGAALYVMDFEAGALEWEMNGLWHLATGQACFQCTKLTGTYAYYAQSCNYDTGVRTRGTLTSPAIDLLGAQFVQVRFDQFRYVEHYVKGAYDKTYLEVSFDDGSWTTLWVRSSEQPSPDCLTVTVGPFAVPAGATTLRLRFVFDSVDKYYNNFPGWAVDNITVAPAISGQPLSALAVVESAPRSPTELVSVFNVPNPVRDVQTTRFIVRGVEAERIRVEVYDLTGRLVWQNEASGNEIVWHTQDLTGLPLANGVYLYKVFVLYGGEWIASAIQKLVILR